MCIQQESTGFAGLALALLLLVPTMNSGCGEDSNLASSDVDGFIGCDANGSPISTDTLDSDLNDPNLVDLTLYVSNQSVKIDTVPIHVEVDGNVLVHHCFPAVGPDEEFPQHYWIPYKLHVQSGTHDLTAFADGYAGATAELTLTVTEQTWLLLTFSGTDSDDGRLSTELLDNEPVFL